MASSPRLPRGARVAAAAFFRVYEPVQALAGSGMRTIIEDVGELAAREHAASLRAAIALPPRLVVDLDLAGGPLGGGSVDGGPVDGGRVGGGSLAASRAPALVLSPPADDGVPRLCPVDLSRRALLALAEARLALQPEVLRSSLAPEAIADGLRQLDQITRRGVATPHVRSRAWHVPPAWFAAFQPTQRVASGEPAQPPSDQMPDQPLTGEPTSADAASGESTSGERAVQPGAAQQGAPPGSRSDRAAALRYLAPMADARRGIARALAVVQRSKTDLLAAFAVADIEETGRWLEEFHARSVVELEFGGLASFVPDDEFDDAASSVALVSGAVALLREESAEQAISLLSAVRDRWAQIRAYERAS